MTTRRGFDRLIAFSDAVVAIAMTLLVLPLVDLPAAVIDGANIGQVLAAAHNELIAFGVSFAVIWGLWSSHHRIFEHYRFADGRTVALNIGWLATIVVLPFPTALLSTPVSERGAVPLYVVVLLISTTLLQVLTWRVRHRPALADPDAAGEWMAGRTEWALPASMVLALVLSLVVPSTGPWVMLLLFAPPVIAMARTGFRRIRDSLRRRRGRSGPVGRVGRVRRGRRPRQPARPAR